MENNKKVWYKSKTIISGLASFLMMLVHIFDLDIDEGLITELLTGIAGVVSVATTIYGRITAKAVIE